jgi:hypothetical protein
MGELGDQHPVPRGSPTGVFPPRSSHVSMQTDLTSLKSQWHKRSLCELAAEEIALHLNTISKHKSTVSTGLRNPIDLLSLMM